MKKGFALVFAIVLVTAPSAIADHCFKCNLQTMQCFDAPSGGRKVCTEGPGTCTMSGEPCFGPHPFTETVEPLGAEFVVASVERLDAPQPAAASETRIAHHAMKGDPSCVLR